MKIHNISIKNLRCIESSVVNFDDYTCLVGPNGAGKSTILCALNIFFRESENSANDLTALTKQDFHNSVTDNSIEITVTFKDLSEEAKQDFKEYVRQDQLVISAIATFNTKTGVAEVKQFGQRLGMAAFKPFFQAFGDGAKAGELVAIFQGLKKQYPDIVVSKTKDAMREALQEYEATRPAECILIPSEDQFYGFSRGSNRLQKYIQWVYVPAVKDASEEQSEGKTGALAKLLARTVRGKVDFAKAVEEILTDARTKYQLMLDANQDTLSAISAALQARLTEWAHPDAKLRMEWQQDSTKAVKADQPFAHVIAGEGSFEGDISRLGHGFQRSFLLALLQELATTDDKSGPRLLLGCEEPELYQHPPQAKHLAVVFESLASDNAQIAVTTHSPYFVVGKDFESIRMVRQVKGGTCSSVTQYTYQEFAAEFTRLTNDAPRALSATMVKLQQTLQPALSEMFFAQHVVLVEGLEDVAYLQSWMALSGRWNEYRRLGIHIVPTLGKERILRPAIIAQGLKIPCAVMFDADGRAAGQTRVNAERENLVLITKFSNVTCDPFPTDLTKQDDLLIWPVNIGMAVRDELVAKMGAIEYETTEHNVKRLFGELGGLSKDGMYIAELLGAVHLQGIVVETLDTACQWVLERAKALR